ncbi:MULTISPECIES: cytochrome P450 [unclassified Tolypothrix]|uniref:cytochrome P450 n=1 Tax=unclassified Tolypothrix TaxID=2649714 RepID=UPI0005EAA86E|nr:MULTISPECIES: cytochrome P450 [unclassified Tolypothrix]BAY92552.1 cytochrome P450 [Microchaete diplosiphon NIES-3275]EKF05620.1 cytochrome P450 [Tolypothrix sp. PCC 7601]MBE9088061.1 cytochrome P450 [Tolypothrix sp. LEGE 11397]UYD26506.1 cytochrome P450 [Tolypothrix sp. PCC 7712]UYD31256.1 cytochrome P450 [Tolypothrix sp. PCC 7601]
MQLPNQLKKPPFLQRIQWVADPVGYMESAAQQYPDLFTARIIGFGNNIVFVNHPQGLQEILTNDRKKFLAIGKENKLLQPLLGDYSIVMLDGDRHRKRRQLVMPSFHGDRMRAYGQLIRDLTEKLLNQLPTNQIFSARNTTQEISLQVILQTVFGVYEGERCEQLKQQLKLMGDLFRSPLTSSFLFFPALQKDLGAWSPWGKFLRDQKKLDQLLYAEIAERRQKPNPERIDILSLLMSATDEAGNQMTDQELRDELITLLVAGYETTATAMAWGLYWIHQKPEVYTKLLQELDNLGDAPDPMSIFRLPYLTAVCNETLRIRPVAMLTFPRVVQEPVELIGYSLQPNTVVIGCMFLTHQREDLYPEHQQFKPERFLERQFSPYEFIPFGGGVRRCLGEALAIFEMKIVLATILSRYQLALADHKPEVARRRGLTLAPANGVKMMITGKRARQESQLSLASN